MSSVAVSSRNFNHLQDAVEAVDKRIKDVNDKTASKVKASSGLILTTVNSSGEIEVLMGRLNKLDRPNPKDEAGVHGSYGVFSGGVELEDSQGNTPTVIAAAAREANEESLGALTQDKVLELLSQSTTRLIKNAGWKFFTAASFHVQLSKEEGDKIIQVFNSSIGTHPQHELKDLAWIPLKRILEVQAQKDDKYNTLKSELEKANGKSFTPDELRANKELAEIYNLNLQLTSEVSVAHFVARTILEGKFST